MHDLKIQNEKNAELLPKVAAQENEIQKLNTKISELSLAKTAEAFTPRPDSAASYGRMNSVCVFLYNLKIKIFIFSLQIRVKILQILHIHHLWTIVIQVHQLNLQGYNQS